MSKYKIEYTTQFKRQYKKMIASKNYKEDDFKAVVNMLANDEILTKKYGNHLLEPKKLRFMGMPYKTRLAFNV